MTHVKLTVWLIVLLIAICIFLNFMSHNAYIIVDTVGGTQDQKITTFASSDAETKKVGRSGLVLVPRDTKSLIITAGSHQKTQVPIDIPWYGFLAKTVDFSLDKNADKIAFNSVLTSTCLTYSPRLQNLLSYDCNRPVSLLQFQTPKSGAWRNVAVASSMYYPVTAKPYLGGVIGIAPTEADDPAATTSPLVFTGDNGSVTHLTTPDGIDGDSLDDADIFTNQRDPKDGRFILVTNDGTVYLGTPGEKKGAMTYVRIETPADFNALSHQTICRIMGDNAYCFRAQRAIGDSRPKTKIDSTITKYLFAGGEPETVKTDKITVIDNLYVTDDGSIYAKYGKKLFRFEKTNNVYNVKELAQNIDSASSGSSLYYVQQGDIYQVDPMNIARLVFHSDNIKSKTVFVADSKVYILGTINDSADTSLHAYVINGQDDTDPGKRVIDLLPTASNQLPYTVSQNLSGNTLQIGLVVAVPRGPGETGTAPSEIEARKQTVLNALTNRGINTDDISVQFVY